MAPQARAEGARTMGQSRPICGFTRLLGGLTCGNVRAVTSDRSDELGPSGGSLPKHYGAGIRRGWLLLLAFVIQLVAIYTITDPTALAAKKSVLALTSAMLLWAVVANLRWWSFRILAVGLLLNTLVMAVNGGLMPATPENLARLVAPSQVQALQLGQTPPLSKNELKAASDIRLRFLSDIIYVGVPTPKVYSAGDVVLAVGVAGFAIETAALAILRRRRAQPTLQRHESADLA